VAGLLGADILAGHDLDLDPPMQRAGLYTVADCPGFLPWPDAAGVALTRSASGLNFVIVDLDGHAVRAMLDTGARGSFMTRRLAASLGITEAMLAADPIFTKIGISRSEIDVRQHRFASISVGSTTWRDAPVAIADVAVPGVDMLLGADLLGRQRLWISPARSMLWLK
jgi:predicted aspartyl protease